MPDIWTTVGIIISLLGVLISWYFGTTNSRKKKKLLKLKKELNKVELYSKSTGYKDLMRDSFGALFYSLSIVFIALGLQQILPTIITNNNFLLLIKHFVAGVYIGAGLVLFDNMITLSRVANHKNSKTKLNNAINELQDQI